MQNAIENLKAVELYGELFRASDLIDKEEPFVDGKYQTVEPIRSLTIL